jgi:hypothetical protein
MTLLQRLQEKIRIANTEKIISHRDPDNYYIQIDRKDCEEILAAITKLNNGEEV